MTPQHDPSNCTMVIKLEFKLEIKSVILLLDTEIFFYRSINNKKLRRL